MLVVLGLLGCSAGTKSQDRGTVTICTGDAGGARDGGTGDGGSADARADGGDDAGAAGECQTVRRPATQTCEDACVVLCDSLSACGSADQGACLIECFLAYGGPGESLGHDIAICDSMRADVEAGSCVSDCLILEAGWQNEDYPLACCPSGEQPTQRCAKCGADDSCEATEFICAPRCSVEGDECAEGEECVGGGCLAVSSFCG